MTNTSTRQYTFSLPEDTADLFDKFCRKQPNSPVYNIASRLIRSGIEVVLMLHPNWQERLDYEPSKMGEAARLSEALRAELTEVKEDRDQLAWIVKLLLEPDTNICCDGMGCGCRGAGTHKYAAYLFAGMKLDDTLKGASND